MSFYIFEICAMLILSWDGPGKHLGSTPTKVLIKTERYGLEGMASLMRQPRCHTVIRSAFRSGHHYCFYACLTQTDSTTTRASSLGWPYYPKKCQEPSAL